jgi:hypothetical protein
MFTEEQGYGAYRGGNTSNITQVDSRALDSNITRISTNEMFVGNIVSIYTNTNNGNSLVFTNDSVFLVDSSVSDITEINTERALEFINESDWLKEN